MSVGLVGFTAREHYRKHSLVVRRVFNHIPLLYTVSVFSTRRGEGTTLARPPFTIDTKTFLNQTHFLLFSSEVMSCARLTFHLETDDTMSGVSMTSQTHVDSQVHNIVAELERAPSDIKRKVQSSLPPNLALFTSGSVCSNRQRIKF